MHEKAVVITGASTGIGKACALQLAQHGFQVFAGVRKTADGDALLREAPSNLTPILIDVGDEASIARAKAELDEKLGTRGLHGLVNNAGVAVGGPLEFLPISELRRQLEINVIGQVAVTQALLPQLRIATGRIVNMGSVGGRVAAPLMGPYAASKFALEAITDSWRRELRPWGLEVCIIEPGAIATPIWEKSSAVAQDTLAGFPERATKLYGNAMTALLKMVATLGRNGAKPEKVADAVEHALTADRPHTRYLVGIDAHIQAGLQNLLTDRTLDFLIAKVGHKAGAEKTLS